MCFFFFVFVSGVLFRVNKSPAASRVQGPHAGSHVPTKDSSAPMSERRQAPPQGMYPPDSHPDARGPTMRPPPQSAYYAPPPHGVPVYATVDPRMHPPTMYRIGKVVAARVVYLASKHGCVSPPAQPTHPVIPTITAVPASGYRREVQYLHAPPGTDSRCSMSSVVSSSFLPGSLSPLTPASAHLNTADQNLSR